MTSRINLVLSLGLTLALLSASTAVAQKGIQKFQPKESVPERVVSNPPSGAFSDTFKMRGLEKKANVQDLIETYRVTKAIKELALTDEQAVKFIKLNQKRREEVEAITLQRREPMRELKVLLDQPDPPQDRVAELVKTLRSLDRKMTDTTNANIDALMDDLTPVQRAKLYLFQNRFEREIREVIEEVTSRRSQPETGLPGPAPAPGAKPEAPLP